MTTSLPALVRRYVERVLPAGRGAGQIVRIEQVGEMLLKAGARARRFTAHEELATDRVSFVWRARFPMLGPISLRVVDDFGLDRMLDWGRRGEIGPPPRSRVEIPRARLGQIRSRVAVL